MSDWRSRLSSAKEQREQQKISSAMSEENLLSRTGKMYDSFHKDDEGYTSLSKKWEDIYKRAVDYYNNESHQSFYDTYSGTRNKTGYVADTGAWYSNLETLKTQNNADAEKLLAELEQYSRYYNPEAISYVRDLITKRKSSYDDMMTDAKKFSDHWGQWGTRQDYDNAVWENNFYSSIQAGDFDAAQTYLNGMYKDVSNLGGEDPAIIEKRTSKLKEYQDYFTQMKEYTAFMEKYSPFIDKYSNASIDDLTTAKESLAAELGKAVNNQPAGEDPLGLSKSGAENIERELEYVSALINDKHIDKHLEYDVSAGQAEIEQLIQDYEEYQELNRKLSWQETEYARVGVENAREQAMADLPEVVARINELSNKYGADEIKGLKTVISEKTKYHDNAVAHQRIVELEKNVPALDRSAAEYEAAYELPVNMTTKQWNSGEIHRATMAQLALSQSSNDREVTAAIHMNEKEREIYNSYFFNGQYAEAEEYYQLIVGDLVARAEQKHFSDLASIADKDLVLSSAASVITSLGSAVEYVWDSGKYIIDRYEDPYRAEMDTNTLAQTTNVIRSTVSDKVNIKIGNWDAFDFVYNTAMSGVDSLAASFIPGGGVVLGLSAAAQGTNDALERGMSSDQAFWNGIMQGAFEGIFESFSIGKFKSLQESAVKGGWDVAKNIAKSMLVNASEEACTEIANIVYDTMMNGDFSNYQQMLDSGMTPQQIWEQFRMQVLESAASGALMGAGFGGIGSGMAYSNEGSKYKSNPSALIEEALRLDPNNKYALQLKEKLEAGEKISQAQLGKLSFGNTETIRSNLGKIDEDAHTRLNERIEKRISSKVEDKKARSSLAQSLTKAISGESVSNAELRKISQNQAALNVLNDEFGTRFKSGVAIGDIRQAISTRQNSKVKLSSENILATYSAYYGMDEAAERSLMVNYASDTRNAEGGKPIAPEDYAALYNAVYVAGKKGNDISKISGEISSVMSESAIAQAYRAGQNAGAAVKSEGSEQSRTAKDELLGSLDIGKLDNNKSYYTLDELGISKKDQAAWISAGIATERNIRGTTVATVNTITLKAELKRRENSQKDLSNRAESGKIETGDGDAIWRYKSSESYKINEAIRSGRELTAEESAFIEELDRDLEKTPKYSGVVYRNMTFDMQGQEALDNFVAGHTIGEIVTYPAYTSTSKTQEGYVVDGELLVHIEISGETGHDVSKGYGIEEEQEVLFGRNTDFYVSSISYDGKTANIVLEEVTYGEGKISGSDKGYNSAQQGYHSKSRASQMQRMQAPEQVDVQKVSERHTEGDSSQREALRGVRGEINSLTESDNGHQGTPDIQTVKENAIEHERVVYSSKSAKAYDAITRDKLSKEQKRVVDVAEQIGRKVVFATTVNKRGVEVDGFIAKNGDIYINPNKNVAPMAFVFKHELAHFAERARSKYQDFKNAVRNSETFKKWLKDKGLTEQQYNAQIRAERAAVGEMLDEPGATVEIMGNFAGEMLFGDSNTLTEDLIRELGPQQRKSVREYIREFFSWIKSKFVGDAGKAAMEVRKLEKLFAAAYQEAVKSATDASGEQFAFNSSFGQQLNDWQKGNGKANGSYNGKFFKLGTTPDVLIKHGAPSGEVIMYEDCLLKITGLKHSISLDELSKIPAQLNDPILLFKGSVDNSFVALTEIKDKIGNDVIVAVHINKRMGRSVINKITSVYSKTDNYGNNKIKNYVIEQINQGNLLDASIKKAPNWFTTSGLQLPHVVQTILDANNSISQNSEKSTQNSKKFFGNDGEHFSYTPQNDKISDVFERLRNGELSINDAEKLLKKPEGDNPATIANLKKEEMGSTPKVSKKTNGTVGGGDSRFAGSVQRSSIFNEDFKKEVGEDNFVKHYAAITNKETLAEAAQRLDEGGEEYVTKWLSKKAVHMDTVDTVVGFILLKRYQDVGNYEGAAAVAQKVRDVGTLSGQRVQAFSIIGRFDADMMQSYAQKELDRAWELAIEGRSDKWLEKHKDQFQLTSDEISFIRDNIIYAAQMPENSRERAIALAQITTLIQSKIPPVRGQSFKAWQRVSMLLNPRTQLRNVAGNAMMAPVFVASDWFSTPIDRLIAKSTGIRTTGLTGLHGNRANIKAMGKGFMESYDDWKRHINTKADEQNRFEIGQGKSFDETKWGRIAKIMNGFDRFNSFLLDAGDRPFYEMWFINSLNEQMRLNKVSEPTEAMVQIAVDEALARTWQDENRMTKMVTGIKKAANQISIAGYGMGDVLIKFTKTPANLTKAIYDFSPAAILSVTPQAVRLTKAIKNGTVTPSMQKKFVSTFGKMAAGTMLYVVFAALYAAGHIKGSSDEDKDVAAFEKYVQGIPEYSIKIGDKWFSYDWAQPIGAVPAIIADYMESRKEGNAAVDSVLGAFKAGGEVLFNQSFMTSFKTLFSAESFSEGILDITLGEVSVPVPTIFSQLANVLDDKRRVTYDGTSEFQSALNRAMLKIPGLRNLLEAEVDVLGREVDNSQKSWFNAFLNPANVYTDTSTDVTDHAYEIYKSTGDAAAIPPKAPYSVALQGTTVKLNDVQRAQYQRAMGETASDLIAMLLDNDVYNAMNDEEKLSVLKQVYSYSAVVAKGQLEWADDYEVISGIAPYITKKDFDAMSYEERYQIVDDYIFSDYDGMQNIESEFGQSNFMINKKTANLVLSATLAGDIDEAVKLIDGIDDRVKSYGWDESDTNEEIKERKTSVKSTLTRYWKQAYLYAYYKKDSGEQNRILNILTKIGLYGDKNEVKEKLAEWVKAYEEENN